LQPTQSHVTTEGRSTGTPDSASSSLNGSQLQPPLSKNRPPTDIPREYLSNYRRGRLPRHLGTFRDANLAGRRLLLESPELQEFAIWQLHEVAILANQDPRAALPYAELGLEMVKRIGEVDLLSWGHSELGKVLRLLNGSGAKGHLDQGVELGNSPYQQANALHQRALFGLRPYHKKSAQIALRFAERAMALSPSGEARINSDRGHPAVLATTALVHCYLGHIDTAKSLYHEVLDTACPQHARRFRRVAFAS
jgi:hypothetical protein